MNGDVLDLLRRRRTIRRYTDENLTDEQINALLEAALLAPSYLGRKPGHLIVIRRKDLQERLGTILSVRPYVQQAAALVALLGDPEISNSWEVDLAAAAENILLAATGMGLGSTWVGNPYGIAWEDREKEIRQVFHIPESIRVFGFIAIGYPAERIEPHTKEDVWDETRIHYDQFSHLHGTWASATVAVEGPEAHR